MVEIYFFTALIFLRKNRKFNAMKWCSGVMFSMTLVFPIGAFSQIFDGSTIWSEANSKMYYSGNNDTVINGTSYHVLHKYFNDITFHYSGSDEFFFLREDDSRVFWLDEHENEEYLLYDLNLSIGDSIYVTPLSYYVDDSVLVICEQIDTIDVMGVNRKRLTMRTAIPSSYYDTNVEYWLDGIGSTLGLLNAGHLNFAYVDQIDPKLFCCHKGFNQVYQIENNNLCHGNTVSLKNVSVLPFIQVYPNPFTDYFTVQGEVTGNFYLIDNIGRSVSFEQNGNDIRPLNCELGIYFLTLTTEKGNVYTSKIIKN